MSAGALIRGNMVVQLRCYGSLYYASVHQPVSDNRTFFQLYQASLGRDEHRVAGAVDLLRRTSKLVDIFNDLRPIKGLDDIRLSELQEILEWLDSWGKQENKRSKLSYQTQEDLTSMICGFIHVVQEHITSKRSTAIVPGRVNSDIVENMFCQQRTLVNGAKTNPTAQDYGVGVNTILSMQVSLSRKRNTHQDDSYRKCLKTMKQIL